MAQIKTSVAAVVLLLAACSAGPSAGQGVGGPAVVPPPGDTPRLLVFVVVDQLRADLLYEYESLFDRGLRRLLDEGRHFTHATHNHGVTETSPGHATLSTGTHPSRHGLVSNAWYERSGDGWSVAENVLDPSYSVVGDTLPGPAGAPDRLQRTGVADWLLDAHPNARVVSLSGKPRSAVLLAGKSRSDVYWYDELRARFVTSTYYADEIPDWVQESQARELPLLQLDTLWESTVPAAAASMTRPDTAVGEGDGIHTFFPHVAQLEGYPPLTGLWLADNPNLDQAVLDLARRAVRARDLGRDETPDYLGLGLSAIDRVGHAYGPRSREQLDNLLRLDRALGDFLEFLDDRVGAGRYAIVFSSDHGVVDLPEGVAPGQPGIRLTAVHRGELEQLLGRVVREETQNGPEALARRLADEAEALPWIGAAWPIDELENDTDSLAVLQRNSMFPGRPTGVLARWGVVYQLAPRTIDWNNPSGTTHGSPYHYDRHVPLIFMGPGITAARIDRPVGTVDVAPTVAAWLRIDPPTDLDGNPIDLTR